MTRHLCTGCHGGWRSARCRPRHGASSIGLEDTPWPGCAHEDRLGSATVALCPEGCATTAHVYVDCTTVVPRHLTGAPSVQGCLGSAAVAFRPEDCATMAHMYVGGTTMVHLP